MSRNYSMKVVVSGHDSQKVAAIEKAAEAEWPFDNWHEGDGELFGYGDGSLCGGESEEEFVDRLAKAIWQANGAFCDVTVDATYLDDLPYKTHCRMEEDYKRIMAEPSPED